MKAEEAIKHILASEGGFTDNPKDPGNWTNGKLVGTKFGISAKAYPNLDIKNLTLDEAVSIYKKDYWNKFKIEELPVKIRLHFFDVCVNSGYSRAVKLLQQALGITADGVIGNQTKSVINKIDIQKYASQRSDFYINLTNSNPSNFTFLKGWIRRVINVTIISLQHES